MRSSVFGGFKGLATYEVFAGRLNAICDAIEELTGVEATVYEAPLHSAYLHWMGHYRLMMERWQSRREIILMISALIQAIHRAKIVKFTVNPGKVVFRHGYIVSLYPDEIAALAFGATVYSSAIQQLNGDDPSCPLTPPQIEAAARELRADPRKARRFRQLLKLKAPKAASANIS